MGTSIPRRRKTKLINVQRHKASCGPVAVANLIKWCGIATSYDRILKFCTGIRAYSPFSGMWPYQLRYVLKTLKIKFKVMKKFTVQDLDRILANEGCVIFVYDTVQGGHCVFIDAKVEGGYRAWNKRKGTPPFFAQDDIEKAIKVSTRRRGGLYAYVVSKG